MISAAVDRVDSGPASHENERHVYTAQGLELRADRPLPGLASHLGTWGEPVHLVFTGDQSSLSSEWSPSPSATGWRLGHRSPVVDEKGEPLLHVWLHAGGARRFVYADGHGFEVCPRGARIEAHLPGIRAPADEVSDALLYLFGPVIAWVARLRGRVALHASAVALPDLVGEPGAVLFVGPAGAGKSTAAAALALQGAPALCDDTAVLDLVDGEVRILPDAPRLRLWPSSTSLLFGGARDLPLLTPGWDKQALDLPASHFVSRPQRVRSVYLLQSVDPGQPQPQPQTAQFAPPQLATPPVSTIPLDGARRDLGWSCEPIAPREALLELLSHASVSELIDADMRRRELAILGTLLEGCPVRRLLRPAGARPADLLACLQADLRPAASVGDSPGA